ncbi:MAG: signal recognition particle protein [Deferribacteraceae bacterium]|jgi:signal recognition particle subunit SRP54|nr:signal recognition particle protein [Deferribacteraceae bacterium]
MFADLGDKLNAVFKKLRGEARITEKNITSAVKQVRMALLEADVNYKAVKTFLAKVEGRAVGSEVLASVSPAQQFIKIVNDELIETLGGVSPALHLSPHPPTIFLMAGLQGSGKTTACGKLARYFAKSGKTVVLAACDIYRPAAIEQLEALARQAGSNFYSDKSSKDPVQIAQDGLSYAKKAAADIYIVDTAGRLHIDEPLMQEVKSIRDKIACDKIFYAADAMSGQDALNSALEFDRCLNITGIILTKTDGDARGGVALSVREVIGKPLYFIGTGEKLDDFEMFHPERMAGRILGMGDVVSLVEKAQDAFSDIDAQGIAKKINKVGLDFDDLLNQFKMMKRLGSLSSIMKLIPGLSQAFSKMGDISTDDKRFKRAEAIILSMTPLERRKPQILNASRKRRIAGGSGQSVQDVNKILNQLVQMNKMMKKMTKNNFSGLF